MDYVSRNPFHLENSMIPIAMWYSFSWMTGREEIQKRNASNGGTLTQILETLLLMKEVDKQEEIPSPGRFDGMSWCVEDFLKGHSKVIPKRSSVVPDNLDERSLSRSGVKGRHYYANSVIINSHSVWYETYIHIEPLPPGVTAVRNEEVVKHEFTHILSNIYLRKPRKNSVVVCSRLYLRKSWVRAIAFLRKEQKKCWRMGVPCLLNWSEMTSNPTRTVDVASVASTVCATSSATHRTVLAGKTARTKCFVVMSLGLVSLTSRYQKLVLFYDSRKGWGVRTDAFIPRGTFVIEYVGEVISQKESEIRRQVCFIRVFDVETSRSDAYVLHESGSWSTYWCYWQGQRIEIHQPLLRPELRDSEMGDRRHVLCGDLCCSRYPAWRRTDVWLPVRKDRQCIDSLLLWQSKLPSYLGEKQRSTECE